MERWQLWSGFFDFALLVLLQKAIREANDNKIEHLWVVIDRYGNFHLTDTDTDTDMLISIDADADTDTEKEFTDTDTDNKKRNSPIPI